MCKKVYKNWIVLKDMNVINGNGVRQVVFMGVVADLGVLSLKESSLPKIACLLWKCDKIVEKACLPQTTCLKSFKI